MPYDPNDPEQQEMLGRLAASAHGAGNVSVAANPSDPAFWMLFDGHVSVPVVHRDDCYICNDDEFAQMGMPLCRPCPECVRDHLVVCTACNGARTTDSKTLCPACQGMGYAGSLGHVAADDTTCDECGGEDGPHQYTGDPEWLITGIPRETALFVKGLSHRQ